MTAPAAQAGVVERVRALLADEPGTREVSMFGGRAFMVNGKLALSVQGDGRVLVRVAADRHDEFVRRPGAAQATMGGERTMGRGWLEVSAATILDDAVLAEWIAIVLDYNRSVAPRNS